MRGVLLCGLLLLESGLGLPASAASAVPATTLSAAQAGADLRLLQRAFKALHPGLTRYRSVEQIDAEFADAQAAVRDGASGVDLYLLATRLAAAVRCGHTWTNPLNQPEALRRALFDGDDRLPVRVALVAQRLLVTASADPQLHAGDELLAIDDHPITAVVAELLPYLRADGSSDGKRLSQVDSGVNGGALDRLWPLLHPPVDGRYRLRIAGPAAGGGARTLSVAGMSVARREAALVAAGRPLPDEAWRLDLDGPVAVLTLPTFAFWGGGFDGRAFLAQAFAEIERRGVEWLVIDLRRNEGGDAALGDALLAHLLAEPFARDASRPEVAFERVPYNLARFLDTWDFGFFDHTGQVQRGTGRNLRLLGQAEGGQPIAPIAPHFRGRAVALVGPQMSSAGFLLARDLQRSGAAVLVGRPTGGNLRGLNGGQLAWITLPNSGVAVDIPLVAWVAPGDPPDRGVLPDVPVTPRFDAAAAGVDQDMVMARELLLDASIKPPAPIRQPASRPPR